MKKVVFKFNPAVDRSMTHNADGTVTVVSVSLDGVTEIVNTYTHDGFVVHQSWSTGEEYTYNPPRKVTRSGKIIYRV